ncbi:NUDIX hydrolase [Pararhodonellum marinum]|uniref:NUDIX hydrolase n=1 Tax=Pararhodonellum marinum TaxID=2755358 RepID=UPI00188F0C6C|nr:CoA pyrophosphatase [Pararhodonellum marinum]
MHLDEIIAKLRIKLSQPLPGREGQILMAPRPVDESRFSFQEGGLARKGAVLLLLYPYEHGVAVPFIKRPAYDGVHGGQISLPGGKWEKTDESLSHTALREAEEEIGIDARKVEIIGTLSNLFIPPSNFSVFPYIGIMRETPVFRPDPLEVDRIIHCDFNDLMNPGIRKSTKLKVRGKYELQAPYFDIEQEVVWGATAMILSELMVLWDKS